MFHPNKVKVCVPVCYIETFIIQFIPFLILSWSYLILFSIHLSIAQSRSKTRSKSSPTPKLDVNQPVFRFTSEGEKTAHNQEPTLLVHCKEPAPRTESFTNNPSLEGRQTGSITTSLVVAAAAVVGGEEATTDDDSRFIRISSHLRFVSTCRAAWCQRHDLPRRRRLDAFKWSRSFCCCRGRRCCCSEKKSFNEDCGGSRHRWRLGR